MEHRYQFSAPGRTEIGGNHTDHQHGLVLAAAVNLKVVADVTENGTDMICVRSEGYPDFCVDLKDLQIRKNEMNTSAALVRGIASAFVQQGAKLRGFDMSVTSGVPRGCGLSSSAAFEVLVGTILNTLFFDQRLSPVEIAVIGQYAENVYFGKPCGLMDQMASAVGGMVCIDFIDTESPKVERIDFDFRKAGYALCIIDSGADHADMTDAYASITRELGSVCAFFGKSYLRQIPEAEFMAALPVLRERVSDRAVLRAMHIYRENARVKAQAAALKDNDPETFLRLVTESGHSSWMYLQNICLEGAVEQQPVAYALALCDYLLCGRGAYRVHGGGFAGVVQAFVPLAMLDTFKKEIESYLGAGSCTVLDI